LNIIVITSYPDGYGLQAGLTKGYSGDKAYIKRIKNHSLSNNTKFN